MNKKDIYLPALLLSMSMAPAAHAQRTAGIGVYPGDPKENFSPRMYPIPAPGGKARYVSAKASSSFDYNLTAQLLADGIYADVFPATLAVYDRDGLLPRRERECAIDGGDWTRNTLMGDDNFLHYEWTGMTVRADHVDLTCAMAYDESLVGGHYDIRVVACDADGKGKKRWRTLAESKGEGLPGDPSPRRVHSDPNKRTGEGTLPTRSIKLSLDFQGGLHEMSDVRVEFRMKGAVHWTVTRVDFRREGQPLTTELLPLSRFGSAWMSDADARQWVTLDMGMAADVRGVDIHWLKKAAEGHVETSLDGKTWTRRADLPGGRLALDRVLFASAKARYVKLVMDRPLKDKATAAWDGKCAYCISEMEVVCDSCADYVAKSSPSYTADTLSLDGGGWLLGRSADYSPEDGTWTDRSRAIPATVPGTVLTSYRNVGRLPDPNVADNVLDISDSFFYDDFWYVRDFSLPAEMRGKRVLLNFDGVNWKAEVWLNGKKIDFIEGAFVRSKVDITPFLRDGDNTLAVLIVKNEHPGIVKEKNALNTDFNGGILGADAPTFHATTGWDWITTVRGRDIGIWNDVYLNATSDVTLDDPVVTTRLDAPCGKATMTPRVVVCNRLPGDVRGVLRGWIGDVTFEKEVTLGGGESREITFSPGEYAQLRGRDMRLWMPCGYGEPYLYDAGFRFVADGADEATAQTLRYECGIREVECRDVDRQLKIYVNGVRVTPLGGNWGFSEQNLNFRRREYDVAVGYHREMNFNMIRNWVGMTGDEEFYDACDRHGVMVWQDFWLANPADGDNPKDEAMFMRNARDFTRRMRRHPSITLYCGRNEGYPPATLDTALRSTVGEMNPGLTYISSSADDGVSGHGPYWAEPPRVYFERQTGKLHSERGMPNVMTFEGLSRTLAPGKLWPQSAAWGQHDFTMAGAQRGASFDDIVARMFGEPRSAEQFTEWAQWENYEGYRAMYESGSKDRQGLLIWMSHSCWPSLTWQCYDYYFEPTAAFFASKKACEPLHIQWNALTRDVEVVNRSPRPYKGLRAVLELTDMYGKALSADSVALDVENDMTVALTRLHVPEKPESLRGSVFFIRLRLVVSEAKETASSGVVASEAQTVLSDNMYVCSTIDGNLQELHALPKVALTTETSRLADGHAAMTVRNASDVPAMMVRLMLRNADGTQILPVHYSDNFFHLMPGETRTIDVRWDTDDAKGTDVDVRVTGFNVRE